MGYLRRVFSVALAVFFAVWSVLFPVTAFATTYQWVTTPVGQALATVSAGGSRTAVQLGALGLGRAAAFATNPAVGIATIVAAYWLNNYQFAPVAAPPAAATGQISYPATSNPPYTLTIPANRYFNLTNASGTWTTFATACATGYAAGGWSSCDAGCVDNGTQSDSTVAAQGWGKTTGACGWRFSVSTAYTCPTNYAKESGTPPTCRNTTTVYSCPSGGTLSGQSCLTDAYVDGTGPVYRAKSDGTGWQPDPLSTDAAESEAPASTATLEGQDSYGNPTVIQASPVTGGGVTYQTYTQTTNNNQTYTTHNVITSSSTGAVTNVSTNTYLGTIASVQGAAAPLAQQGTPQPFPDDYNREATQLEIREELKATTAPDMPADQETRLLAGTTETDDGLTQQFDNIPLAFGGDKDNWFSWVWTPPLGSCSPFTGSVHGFAVSWDLCPYIENIRDTIGFMFALFGSWVAYNEMFRREA